MSQWKNEFLDIWLTPYLSIWYILSHLLNAIKINIVTYIQQYCQKFIVIKQFIDTLNDNDIIIFDFYKDCLQYRSEQAIKYFISSFDLINLSALFNWFKCIVTLRSKIEYLRWNHKVKERDKEQIITVNNLKFEFEYHKWFHFINSLLHWVENIFRRYST